MVGLFSAKAKMNWRILCAVHTYLMDGGTRDKNCDIIQYENVLKLELPLCTKFVY